MVDSPGVVSGTAVFSLNVATIAATEIVSARVMPTIMVITGVVTAMTAPVESTSTAVASALATTRLSVTSLLAALLLGSDESLVILLVNRSAQGRAATGHLGNVVVATRDLGLYRLHPGLTVQTSHCATLMRQDKRDDGPVVSGASGTAGAVQVVLEVHRRIDLQHQSDVIDVNSSGRDVSGNQDRQGTVLECRQHAGTGTLGQAAVQSTSHDAGLTQLLGHPGGTSLGSSKDDGVADTVSDLAHQPDWNFKIIIFT